METTQSTTRSGKVYGQQKESRVEWDNPEDLTRGNEIGSIGTNGHERVDQVQSQVSSRDCDVQKPQSVRNGIPSDVISVASKRVSTVTMTTSSSAMRRKQLEAAMEAERRMADLDLEKVEIRRRLVEKELKLKQAIMNECDSTSLGSEIADEVFVENDEAHQADAKVEDWLEKCPNGTSDPVAAMTEIFRQLLDAKTSRKTSGDDEFKKYVARQGTQRDLPPFSGKAEEWPLFLTRFRNTTQTCGYTNEENLTRLQKALCGKARESVLSLLVLPTNVDKIMRTLELRFGRPDLVIGTLVSRAKGMAPPSERSMDSLVEFGTGVENLVNTMEAMDYRGHMSNPQLLEDLVSKLPYALRLKWGSKVRKLRPEAPTLRDFADWITEKTEAACLVASSNPVTSVPVVNQNRNFRPETKRHLYVTNASTDSCPSCGCGNKLEICQKFKRMDVPTRWNLVREKRLCMACLSEGHGVKTCDAKKPCGSENCEKIHHPLLHTLSNRQMTSRRKKQARVVSHSVDESDSEGTILLRILPIVLTGTKKSVKTYAMCDEGSTVTLVDQSLADEVGFSGTDDPFSVSGVCGIQKRLVGVKKTKFEVSGRNSESTYTLNARTVPKLDLPVQQIKLDTNPEHLKIESREWNYGKCQPKVLIGLDNYHLIVPQEVVQGSADEPVLTKNQLGWSICGINKEVKSNKFFSMHMCLRKSDEDLHELVKGYFDSENSGVTAEATTVYSEDEKRAIQIVDESSKLRGNRWEVGLPWKDDYCSLPKSRAMAFSRLKSIEKKMDSDPEFADLYCEKIEDYIRKGYAVKLGQVEEYPDKKTWYLPHFGVTNPNKPGKFRLVFDAAAKVNGKSLNDFLLTGPDLLKPLPGILSRFRQRKIGFSGDIKEMFHQIEIRDDDSSAQRFLWRGKNRNVKPDVYYMKAMIFGASCSPFMAQYVKNKNAHLYLTEFPAAAKAVENSYYMDDYLDCADTEADAIRAIQDMTEINKRGGFQICQWTCSSRKVLEHIPSHLRAVKDHDLQKVTDLPVERVLGMTWDPNTDDFLFKVKFSKCDPDVMTGEKTPTKREVLKVAMSVFDPLGFLAHYTIQVKIMLQDLWKEKLNWDDKIPQKYGARWASWIKMMEEVKQVRIPRCYSPEFLTSAQVQLHVFCDASQKAYSAVAYFRVETSAGGRVSFVAGKARVVPSKLTSIPRLELQGAVTASRLCKTIIDDHSRSFPTYFWTDSKIVLCWIKSRKSFKQYVAHRLEEIHELTNVHSWRYVPTKMNVADDATRDCSDADLSAQSRWLCGPKFLMLRKEDWPHDDPSFTDVDENSLEVKREKLVNVIIPKRIHLPDVEKFSSLTKLLRSTAYVLRFVKKLKKLQCEKFLTVAEVRDAEILWIKTSQEDSFGAEIDDIRNGIPLSSKSKIHSLSPYLDNSGILRVRGRTDRANNATDEVKRPIILDPAHPYTKLLLDRYHIEALHHGQEYVLNEVRQKFWILSGRKAVRSAWSRCLTCRQRRATPLETEMAPLPETRLQSFIRPFTHSGLDFFGPLEVTVGRHREKRYGAIFTCMSTRAIHLEIAHNLTTDATIMAIQRMIARRGQPISITSDNGTNFHGANNELKKCILELDQNKLSESLTSKGIQWRFNPPVAPHMGGSWERLIRSVKSSLYAILKEKAPKDETLLTLMTHVEGILNSRPLTHVPVDHDDQEALTPNHFLIGTSSVTTPYDTLDEADLCLRKQWRVAVQLANQYWRRWVKEYLPTLTRRTKWFTTKRELKTGDVVIIADPNAPRNLWLKGLVTKLLSGRDGKTRIAEVKTTAGVYTRPVTRLCPLDVAASK